MIRWCTTTGVAVLCIAAASRAAPPDYLIVHDVRLAGAAERWAEYRTETGHGVAAYAVPAADEPAAQREAIRRRIAAFAAAATPGVTPAVLLLGDDVIPAWYVDQDDPTLAPAGDPSYATDYPYQVAGDPMVALGRVPARTNEQALAVLEKIKRYERSPPGPWRRRITYVGGEPRFGAADQLLEGVFQTMVEQAVPASYDVSVTYANPTSIYCPPPDELTRVVLGRLGEGALLFNYLGHGGATGLDSLTWNGRTIPILRVADVQHLDGTPSALPIAVLTCCSAGWFDLPGGEPSLGESMLLHPAGPVAVIAGSRPTHPYANAVLEKDLTRVLLVDRVETVGELDLRTKQAMLDIGADDRDLDMLAAPVALAMNWPTKLGGLRRMHVRLYNLLGDPATRIARPDASVEDLRLAAGTLTGRVAAMHAGTVEVTVETDRAAPQRSPRIVPVSDGDDPDLNAKAAQNYAIANDVVLLRRTATVDLGAFAVELGDLPAGAAVIKVYAAGVDGAGRTVEAFDAIAASSAE